MRETFCTILVLSSLVKKKDNVMIGTYILRMMLATIAVCIGVSVLWPQVQSSFLANPVINGVILGVLVLGIVLSYRQVLRLKNEWNWVESTRVLLNNYTPQQQDMALSRPTGTHFLAGRPVLLAPLVNMIEDRQKVGAEISLSPASMRYLLDSISLRLEENSDMMRYFVGLLVFIGLLGTFWGLMQTLESISVVVQNFRAETQNNLVEAIDSIRAALSQPISGMGTAFSSSLFGLASSLFLGLLSLFANQAQNRFYNEIEEWFSSITRLGSATGTQGGDQPIYIQSLLEHTADALDKLGLHLRQGNEQQRRLIDQMSSMTERLGQITESNEQAQLLRQLLLSHQRFEKSLQEDRQHMTEQLRDELRLLGKMLSHVTPGNS